MLKNSKSIHWVSLQGFAECSLHEIIYKPSEIKEGPNKGQMEVCVLRSSKYFQSGSVEFEAQLSTDDSRCQLILNHGMEQEYFIGINLGPYAYGVAGYRSSQWESLASSGYGHPAKTNAWIKISIIVEGSSISLFVDSIKVCSCQANIQKAQLGLFLHGSGGVQVRNFTVCDKKPKAFVVMQFTDEFNALYDDVIRPACERYGYEVIRADNVYTNGLIIDDITKNIQESSVIIADITPSNLNVYYEVGYAHGINKATILLCDKSREKLPFDISGFRTLFYENTIGGKSGIEDKLNKHLDGIRG